MTRYFLFVALLLVPSIASAQYRGDVPVGETLSFCFNTVGSDGAPITIAGTPAIEVYEEGGTTQITAGTTITEDLDSLTGLHLVTIAATGANGYEAGKWYDVVIAGTTPTADSVSILGRTLGTFRVVVAETVAGTPAVDTVAWLGTAAATPTTAGVPEVDVVLVDGAATSTSLASAADIADAVWDEPTAGHVTGGTYGQQIFTEIDANGTVINTIAGYTDDIGVAGAGLTAIPWNAAWDAEVESEVDDALGGGTGTALSAIPWNASWDAEVQSEAADALTAGLGSIADAIWDEATAGHVTGGTYGAALLSEHEDSQTLLTTANSSLVTIDGIVDSVVADTNELQTDWADGGRLDLLLDTAAAGGGGGGTSAIDMQSTTIATLASQTSFTLTAGSADDDAYPAGSLVFVTDQSTSTQKCVGLLRSYTGSTKTVTLAEDPGIFTMATGDSVDIVYLGPPKVRGN